MEAKVDWGSSPIKAEYWYKHQWYRIVNDKLYVNEKKGKPCKRNTYHWALAGYVAQFTEKMIPRPKPKAKSKPVYTQSMVDEGIVPDIGMMFATEAGDYHVDNINDKSICFVDENGFYIGIPIGQAKPIKTDEDKATDYLTAFFSEREMWPTDDLYRLLFKDMKEGRVPFIKFTGSNHND